jgi:cytochrome b561
MDQARRTLHILQIAFLIAILLYVYMSRTAPTAATPNWVIFYGISALAVGELGAMVVFRKIFILRSEEILQAEPQDTKALARWRTGYICLYCFALAIAIYGLLLHFLGFGFVQVAPFFAVGAIFILLLSPRRAALSR